MPPLRGEVARRSRDGRVVSARSETTPQTLRAGSPCTGEPKDEEKKEGWEISGQFSVDVVATPRVDLCGAAARDLNYREANGKFPMESRSQLAKEQEKLNSFLRYVNESFIIKGFSRASVQERANVRGFTSGNSAPILQRGTATELCDFDISHGDNAQLLVLSTITGDAAASGKEAAVLSVVLMENGVDFDGVIGVSAGAAFGCNYKSKQIGRVIRYNTRFCADKRYGGLGSLVKTGDIYNTDFCYGTVPLELDPFDFTAYDANPQEFYVVCTDIESGQPVYHKYLGQSDHGFDWIRASASMPLVSRIVEIEGRKLLDGGIADSIPVRYFQSIGYDRNVVVLTQPKGYRKGKNSIMPLIRHKYKRYPNLVTAMENRPAMYNETVDHIAQEETAGRLLVIRPPQALPVDRVEKNPEHLKAAYNIGRQEAEKRLAEVKAYLLD